MGVPAGTKSFPAMDKLVPHPELSADFRHDQGLT